VRDKAAGSMWRFSGWIAEQELSEWWVLVLLLRQKERPQLSMFQI
jgi:hypothetical protein